MGGPLVGRAPGSGHRLRERPPGRALPLWLASDEVSRNDFRIFARSLDRESRYQGLQNISWREVVRQREAAGFVAEARADGEQGFTIRPPARRPVYYVTRFSYPPTVYSSRLGLDGRAIPAGQRPIAYELILPVYMSDTPLDTDAERRRAVRGWVSGQFRASDFLRAALATTPGEHRGRAPRRRGRLGQTGGQ